MTRLHSIHRHRKRPIRLPAWLRRLNAWCRRRLRSMPTWQRITCGVVAAVIVVAAVTPTLYHLIESRRYQLDDTTRSLIGQANPNLAAKLTYDQENSQWQFNKDAIPPTSSSEATADPTKDLPAALKAQIGGVGQKDESLYAINFPTDPKKGVTFIDTQTELSFTMTPQFKLASGQASDDGRLVYPMSGGAKLIYTAKNNGMKEDIVLPKFIGKELTYSYRLDLPATLDAQILDDGSVGIFSADPILFSNMSTSSDMDAEKLRSAREQGEKTHLLFAIPAPAIVQTGDTKTKATARFGLSGDTLTVTARDMDTVTYPVSVDPSIVVTSASDFATGNNEGNIHYNNGQIDRGGITGGGITGGWTSTGSGSLSAREAGGSAVYNGYLYWVGGGTTDVSYAPINSNGTVGAWGATTSLPSSRLYPAAVPYNGKLYVYGGYTSGTSALASVIYADINSDGTLGSWTSASNSMATAVCRFGWTSYNGYLYAAGGATGTVASDCGNGSSTMTNTIQYAPILATGDVGTWSTSASTFTSARKDPGMAVYNGYVYLTGGTTDGSTTFTTTQIAKVGANGDIGSWRSSSQPLPSPGKYRFGYRAYNGYLYLSGGTNNMTGTLYAQIYANGDIGPWTASATMSSPGRHSQGFALYQGYAYYFGGNNNTTTLNDTGYAKIDDPGITGTTANTTSLGATISAVTAGASFVYNGYIYSAGGHTGSGYTTQVSYAPINTDGTIGTWQLTSSLTAPAPSGVGLGTMAFALYNNRIYLMGGISTVSGSNTAVASVQYASFNTNGTLSAWTLSANTLPNAIGNQAGAAYNGYLYVRGSSGNGYSDRVQRAQINSDGSVGTWSEITSGGNRLAASTSFAPLLVYGNYMYSIGGSGPAGRLNTVQYAEILADGSFGTWTTTNAMNTTRVRHGAAIINGYMYAYGGLDTNDDPLSSVEYAKINSDGSLGTWKASTDLSVTFSNGGYAAWNDTLYVVSGSQNGSRVKNTRYVKVRSGGGGTTDSWTTSGNTFSTGRTSHSAIAAAGYLYVMGGIDSGGNYLTSVQYAKLGDDGTIGSWSSTTALPGSRSNMGAVAYGSNVFIFGGKSDSSTTVSTVYSAALQEGGLGSWSALGNLPVQLASMATASSNGYIYLLGGSNGSSPNNTVRYALLGSDGTIGSWSTTNAFSTSRYGAGAVASSGYLYLMGGIDSGGNYLSDVRVAPINSTNGTIGSWSRAADMNYPKAYMTPLAQNGFVYAFGGYDGTSRYNSVEYSAINSDGKLGDWRPGKNFSTARDGHQTAVYNGYVYLTGGYSGSYLNNVQIAPLLVTARQATYSKLFDLGALYSLTSISYDGTLPYGLSAITYKTAGGDGVLSSASSAADINPSSPPCAAADVRYVLVSIAMDDSTQVIQPDIDAVPAQITSLVVGYSSPHPEPGKRLAHGKFFQEETLQPLDTCS